MLLHGLSFLQLVALERPFSLATRLLAAVASLPSRRWPGLCLDLVLALFKRLFLVSLVHLD
eukprot:8419936-Lingulodinium_polyedra.AAC.1